MEFKELLAAFAVKYGVKGLDGSDGAKTTPQAVKTIAKDVSALPPQAAQSAPGGEQGGAIDDLPL